MEDKLIIGIDAGTTNIKCAIYNLSFQQIASADTKNSLIRFEDGRIEQDMNLLWRLVSKTITKLITERDINPGNIEAIGLTGQGEGFWAIDSFGNPVRPAILWCDNRAGAVAEKVAQDALLSEMYRKQTGSFPFAGAQMIILKWLKEYEPETLEKAKTVFFCKDWLRYRLTGHSSIEYTDASTSIIDLNSRKVAKHLFEELNIGDVVDKIPELKKSASVVGNLTNEAARDLGLNPEVPVVSGLIDIAATALGSGAVNVGDCCTILGTTSCNEVVTADLNMDGDNVAGYEIDAFNSNYLNVMASMSGTGNIDWFIREFVAEDLIDSTEINSPNYEKIEQELTNIDIGSGGVIYHPYISSAGERSPFIDLNAKAQFFGISALSTKYHLLRAVYEGVAYSIRDNLDATSIVEKIFLTGGGARSRLWAQIISDVTGRSVFLMQDTDPAARGAALIAGIGTGLLGDFDSVMNKVLVSNQEIMPDNYRHKVYSEFYEIYLQLRKQNCNLWKKRKETMEGMGEAE